jgi:hypothetical protein
MQIIHKPTRAELAAYLAARRASKTIPPDGPAIRHLLHWQYEAAAPATPSQEDKKIE